MIADGETFYLYRVDSVVLVLGTHHDCSNDDCLTTCANDATCAGVEYIPTQAECHIFDMMASKFADIERGRGSKVVYLRKMSTLAHG